MKLMPALPETVFDILYLIFAISSGIWLIRKAGSRKSVHLMGLAALLLGAGDAFHLVPRMLNYWIAGNWTAALGIGKLVTSITMTVFYLLLEYIRRDRYRDDRNKNLLTVFWILAAVRVILCAFPQNGWTSAAPSLIWGVIRNIPFVMIGVITIALWFRSAGQDRTFHLLWLAVLLSFLFYVPVVLWSGKISIIGMLMLPKTVMYIWMICMFRKAAGEER